MFKEGEDSSEVGKLSGYDVIDHKCPLSEADYAEMAKEPELQKRSIDSINLSDLDDGAVVLVIGQARYVIEIKNGIALLWMNLDEKCFGVNIDRLNRTTKIKDGKAIVSNFLEVGGSIAMPYFKSEVESGGLIKPEKVYTNTISSMYILRYRGGSR